jgi:NADPH2:quinone reductase
MFALRFYQFGPPEVLRVQEIEKPHVDDGEVLIEVHAAGINPSDVKNVQGAMHQTTLPRTPGRDFAGVIVEGPAHLLGQEVWGTGGDVGFTRDGSHAQYLLLPQDAVFEKPRNLSFEEASVVGVSYVTAWSALVDAANIGENDVVAIVGAHGSVGSAAVQIAKWKGATVIGIVRHESQRQSIRQLGADEVVDSGRDDMRAAVMDLTQGRGASVVFDTVGGNMFEPCLGLLAQRGRQLEIAATTIRRVSFDLRNFYHRETRLFGVDSLQLTVSAASTILNKLKSGFESGVLHPAAITESYSLQQARQAYEHVAHGAEGKVVLLPRF